MRSARRTLLVLALVAGVVGLPAGSSAGPNDPNFATFDYTQNMHPMGSSSRPVVQGGQNSGRFNSDLAFWGTTAYQGHYNGFRIIDISEPGEPVLLNDYTQCVGDQGDVVVWEHLLVRSWNSPAGATSMCGGQLQGMGWEGIHIFDVRNPLLPLLVGRVETSCGSHTATGVPDPENGRLLIYNSASSGSCPGIDIIEIPLDDPGAATLLRTEPSGRSCHDTGVILGEAMLAACAGGNGVTVWSLGGERGGSLEDPLQLYSRSFSGVSIGHSAAFSWDGSVLVFGHEPGGGGQARCQSTSATVDKTLFFLDAPTGAELGRWVLPRPQTNTENCTIHNYNVVPSDKRNILVSGNYQSGIAVVDFTDPANPREIAFADPAPLSQTSLVLGGDWSSYWYDGRIYESDITRGLLVWTFSGSATAGHRKTGHLNPQTQELTLPLKQNRVRNPSFEEASAEGGGPDGWSGSSTDAGETSWTDDGDGGSMAVTITGTGGSVLLSGAPTWSSEPFEVGAGETLEVLAPVRAAGASSAPAIELAFLAAGGTILDRVEVLAGPPSTQGFAVLEATVTVPAGAVRARLVLRGFAPTDLRTSGTVTFDDVGVYST